MHEIQIGHRFAALALAGERGYRLRVSASPPNYIWRKQASATWLREREVKLETQTGGTHAVIERPGHLRLAVEFFCENKRRADELRATFGGSVIRLPADWEARLFASQQTKPLRIGHRLVVRSDPDASSKIPVLAIPAGVAFGTGEHATTAMSLRLLERVTRQFDPGWRMLDAGTGSGILALAARRFGAREVVAIDNDPKAIRTARENARRNRLRGVKFILGDIHDPARGEFEIITANLYSELLVAMLPRFRKSLAQEGRLILSGVLRTQEARLRRALAANGFRPGETRRRGKWIALQAINAS